MTIPKLALTFEEAAEACGYSVRTLKYQVAAGNLMARYANSKGVIRVEDLAQWLDDLPAEPKGSHRPVSALEDEGKGATTNDTIGNDVRATEAITYPRYRKPEDVAPELGMKPTELRRFCRESGIHTRLGSNRIMLSHDDIERLMEWIRGRQAKKDKWWTVDEAKKDPFA
ncbi:DNA-binding protein [Paenarthrobacter nicotinovorans]|uniref:DNA-binding protein n=1 Tax=Paenarthrobacter nicotinovorans TaxID=29320 RepID=UPI0009A7E172|nr:DNA-binding protein [Paenarthrobacter nicotinovorans]MDI2021172.1 hypothetical protein [Paenarthrobacter nicotinovorans]SKB67444.1 hypothetical protein SAMN05660916_02069 [Arthrobacter sp. 31Cvi3.1E]